MSERRAGATVRDLARGPGRLCAAFAIDQGLDGVDLCATNNGALWLAPEDRTPGAIGVSCRIGLSKATDAPLRFFERGSAFVSGAARLNA